MRGVLITRYTAVYWLVFFSIVFHGLSIPALDLIYKFAGVKPIQDDNDAVEVRPLSYNVPHPTNSEYVNKRGSVIVYNRFSRGPVGDEALPTWMSDSNSVESLEKIENPGVYERRTNGRPLYNERE